MQADLVFTDCHVATMAGPAAFGAVTDAAVAVTGGRIAWVGKRAELPGAARETVACDGAWLTPGLVDCHTHLVFAGRRTADFSARLGGQDYAGAALAGGGILTTVAAVRAASEDALLAEAADRLRAMQESGATTVEVKSGYGLDLETELKMLRVAGRLAGPEMRVARSFLGLHAVPDPAARREFVRHVLDEMLPAVVAEGLAEAADAFLEHIAFDVDEVSAFFRRARTLGLALHLHADQLSDGGGAALAASLGALSADHLEHAGAEGIAAMARAGTVAVLLPGAFLMLREERRPGVAAMRAAGAAMAVATDCNPGSSPLTSLTAAMNLACTLFGLTPEEALAGVTREAARALGRGAEIGTVEEGKRADLALWRAGGPAELSYWIGGLRCAGRWIDGRRCATPSF